jgi:hypothetical protein
MGTEPAYRYDVWGERERVCPSWRSVVVREGGLLVKERSSGVVVDLSERRTLSF